MTILFIMKYVRILGFKIAQTHFLIWSVRPAPDRFEPDPSNTFNNADIFYAEFPLQGTKYEEVVCWKMNEVMASFRSIILKVKNKGAGKVVE